MSPEYSRLSVMADCFWHGHGATDEPHGMRATSQQSWLVSPATRGRLGCSIWHHKHLVTHC
jgi:hypothetical protein